MTPGALPQFIDAIEGQLDWPALFPDDHPRELEIGSGKGLFLLNASRRYPEINFVGIELTRKYARRSAERLARLGLSNARVIWGDARRLLATSVPATSLQAIHVYFPDPWWKKRHRKRRMFQPEFVAQAGRVLVPAGRIEIATDVESYHDDILALMRSSPEFEELPPLSPADPQHDLDYLTHFERKYRIEGRSIFRSRFVTRGPTTTKESSPCESATS